MDRNYGIPILVCLAVMGGSGSFALAAAEDSKAQIQAFATHSMQSKSTVNYQTIDKLLEVFVVEERGDHVVRYSIIKGEGQRVIESLVAGFEKINLDVLNRDEQLAYWLNLRLMMILHSTSEEYPRADPEKLLRPDSEYLTTPLIELKGVALSIADVDRILRTYWEDEPNLIYGMHIPIKGAPDFPLESYTGAQVHQQLATTARQFVNQSDAIKVAGEKAKISEFFEYYQSHFDGEAAMIAHFQQLAEPRLSQKLAGISEVTVLGKWRLNELRERSFASGLSDFNSPSTRSPSIGSQGVGS